MRPTLLCLLLTAPAAASTLYVSASAPPGGSGTSWSSPYNDLQLALAVATNGDEIRISQGTYKPALPGGPRTATFSIPIGVTLRGGFAGPASPTPDDRNTSLYVTTLSGDLNGNDGANFSNMAENSFHIVTITAGSASTGLDGLTIRSGFTGGVGNSTGGAGLRATNCSPTIIDCTFTANDGQTGGGGGAFLSNFFGDITRCTFRANRTQSQGGGLHISGSGPHVTDCLIESNIGGSGAGVFSTNGSDGTFTRCIFKTNVGQIGSSSGAGFYENVATSWLKSCTFIRNTTGGGGGALFCSGAPLTQVQNCTFIANQGTADGGGAIYTTGSLCHTVFTNCFFTGNRSDLASGTTLFAGPSATVDITSCTIVNSGAGMGFGTIRGANSTIRIYNSVMAGNTNQLGSGQGAQFSSTLPTVIDHCLIQGWTGSFGGIGNSGTLPTFTDLDGPDNIPGNEDDNAHFLPGSPGIDAAANNWLTGSITTDIDGNPRRHDDPGTPDTGSGTAPIADIGCYEFQGTTCYANCDLSQSPPLLTANDFQCFLNKFSIGSSYANCDGSAASPTLTANDFQCFLNLFAQGCPV